MIKTHIREMAEKRGITTAYQLQKALGISPNGAARLYRDEFEMIGFVTLDALCRVLRCKPGNLIEYLPYEKD